MPRISNIIIIAINSITLILGLAAVIAAVHFQIYGGSICQKKFLVPLLTIIGLFASLVSILGLLGPCLKANWAFAGYFVLLGLLILGIFIVTIVGVAATKGAARKYGESGVLGLGKAARWLQLDVLGYKHWPEVASCLADFKVCKGYSFEPPILYDKPHGHYTRLQSGCCKPPVYCGFKHKNGTFWEEPPSGPAETDLDCKKWSNEPRQLCYNCDACHRGMKSYIVKQWKPLAITNLCIFTFVMIISNVAHCAKRNVRAEDPRNNVRYDRESSNRSSENNTSAILPAHESVRSHHNV